MSLTYLTNGVLCYVSGLEKDSLNKSKKKINQGDKDEQINQ